MRYLHVAIRLVIFMATFFLTTPAIIGTNDLSFQNKLLTVLMCTLLGIALVLCYGFPEREDE